MWGIPERHARNEQRVRWGERSEGNIQDLTNRLNEAVSSLEQYKTQREDELEELREKSENLSDDIIDLRHVILFSTALKKPHVKTRKKFSTIF
jgi:predicted  nucleic acid-binding Zn-ribbon protein